MDAPSSGPVTCPLCGAAVSPRPDPKGKDLRALERHLTEACPSGTPP